MLMIFRYADAVLTPVKQEKLIAVKGGKCDIFRVI
jgi:hypothetical protein